MALHPLRDGDDLLGLGDEGLGVLGLRVEGVEDDGVAVRRTPEAAGVVAAVGPVGAQTHAAALEGHDDHLLGAADALAVELHAADHVAGVQDLQLGHGRAAAALDGVRFPVEIVHVDVVVKTAAAADGLAEVIQRGVGFEGALAEVKVGALLVEVRARGC